MVMSKICHGVVDLELPQKNQSFILDCQNVEMFLTTADVILVIKNH